MPVSSNTKKIQNDYFVEVLEYSYCFNKEIEETFKRKKDRRREWTRRFESGVADAKQKRDQALAEHDVTDVDLNWQNAIGIYNRLLNKSLETKAYSFEDFLMFFGEVVAYYNNAAKETTGANYAEQESEILIAMIRKLDEYRTARITPALKMKAVAELLGSLDMKVDPVQDKVSRQMIESILPFLMMLAQISDQTTDGDEYSILKQAGVFATMARVVVIMNLKTCYVKQAVKASELPQTQSLREPGAAPPSPEPALTLREEEADPHEEEANQFLKKFDGSLKYRRFLATAPELMTAFKEVREALKVEVITTLKAGKTQPLEENGSLSIIRNETIRLMQTVNDTVLTPKQKLNATAIYQAKCSLQRTEGTSLTLKIKRLILTIAEKLESKLGSHSPNFTNLLTGKPFFKKPPRDPLIEITQTYSEKARAQVIKVS